MKAISSLVIVLCLPVLLSAQNDTTFNISRYYFGSPSNTWNEIEAITSTDSNWFLAVGLANSIDGQKLGIVKTDLYGNSVKTIYINPAGCWMPTYPANTMITDRQGNILVASSIDYFGQQNIDGYLIKLNADLDTFWARAYDLPGPLAGCPSGINPGNYFGAIRQTWDDGYIIAGNYEPNCQPGTQYNRACLLKTDSAGNVQWWKAYPDFGRTFDIEVMSDSTYIMIFRQTRGLSLVKIDAAGDTIWVMEIEKSYYHTTGHDIEFLNDSIAIVASQYVYDENVSDEPKALDIFKINLNTRNILWLNEYHIFLDFQNVSLHQNLSLKILKDSSMIILGTAYVANSDTTAYGFMGILYKLDKNGDSLWLRNYSYGNFSDRCQFNDLLLTDDGGFLGVGYHFPYTGSYNAGAWLVKTDSNGYAPGCYNTGIEKPVPLVSTFTLYPNPTTDRIWIEWDRIHRLPKSGLIRIMDINGREAASFPFAGGSDRIEVSATGLAPGVYLVNIVLENGERLSQKLVVR